MVYLYVGMKQPLVSRIKIPVGQAVKSSGRSSERVVAMRERGAVMVNSY